MVRMNKQEGYTLIEMLLVLFIFGVLSLIATSFIIQMEKDVYEDAKNRFMLTLYTAQAQAVTERDVYLVYVIDGQVTVRTNYETISSWSLPENMSISLYANIKRRISFYSNGNIMEIGKVHIQTPYENLNYRVNLSRGRLVLE